MPASAHVNGFARMALEQACFISFEYDRMIVQFSMRDGDKVVPCSTSAMDELEGAGHARASEREAQFGRLRERIEAGAASKYLASEFEGTRRREQGDHA